MTTRFTSALVADGETLTLTAPYTVSGGSGALVGSIFGVAKADVASGVDGQFQVEGVFYLDKTTSQAWTQGQKIFWNDSTKKCTSDATAGQLIGVATVAAGSSDTFGYLRLNESVPSMLEGAEGAVADLIDSSGGGTADGTIGAVTNPTLSDWNGSSVYPSAAQATAIGAAFTALKDAVKELSTKQNALLAALRLNGIIAP